MNQWKFGRIKSTQDRTLGEGFNNHKPEHDQEAVEWFNRF